MKLTMSNEFIILSIKKGPILVAVVQHSSTEKDVNKSIADLPDPIAFCMLLTVHVVFLIWILSIETCYISSKCLLFKINM